MAPLLMVVPKSVERIKVAPLGKKALDHTPLFWASAVGVPWLFCFEISVSEGRGGEMGGDGTNQNKSPETLTAEAQNNGVEAN